MYAHDHDWMDSAIGHPWGVGEKLNDVYVVRFSKTPDATVGNSVAEGQWLHAMTFEYYSDLSVAEKKEFARNYGAYVSLLHIKYGEIVGVQGWDVCFLPSDVIDSEVVEDLLRLTAYQY
jgi:hypothetical protein